MASTQIFKCIYSRLIRFFLSFDIGTFVLFFLPFPLNNAKGDDIINEIPSNQKKKQRWI